MSPPFGDAPTSVPLVLLPVHLETRLVRSGAQTQVLVRIYPDDLHGDSHDPRLTTAEETWGRHFWTHAWAAGGDAARQNAAWRQLVEQFGAPRAAFIADTLRPLNGATPPAGSPAAPPQFPSVTTRPEGWSRPALPRGLPDQFVAIVYAGGHRFVQLGRAIIRPLTLSPTMDGSAPGFDAADFERDPHAGWLVDFAAAEEAGMALRVACDVPHGTPLQRVLVLGVKSGVSVGTEALLELTRAHFYATGLGFVRQSTPTNNTQDGASGYSSSEAGYRAGPLAEVAATSATPGDGSNAEVTARALGLDAAWLARLEHGSLGEQRDAYHMNNALWSATWGYFLEQLFSGSGVSAGPPIRAAREHFASYVRARGPLPAWRVGSQPYGLLPAISLDRWQPLERGAIDAPLVRAVIGLREVWRRALPLVPRVTGTADVALELLSVLQMRPVSNGFGMRVAQPLVALGPVAPYGRIGSEPGRQLAESLGITWLPRQLRTMLAVPSTRVDLAGVSVQAPSPAVPADRQPLSPNYLAWLSTSTWTDMRGDTRPDRPDALLYLMMRHAALREYSGAATRLLVRKGVLARGDALDPDTLDRGHHTPWTMLATPIPTLAPAGVGAFLDTLRDQLRRQPSPDLTAPAAIWRRTAFELSASAPATTEIVDDISDLAAFDRSLAYLASRATGPLTRSLAETVDLSSHRLDAWMTSIATKRLEWLRQRTPTGVVIGAYGWVEDVERIERTPATPPASPADIAAAPELVTPLYSSSSTFGYVHAPSLPHATTAAILRSGYLSRRASDETDWLAVNLGSRRVRTALWLLDGIRSGQSLGALLGYRFERGLHEGHPGLLLDHYILSFRTLTPLAGDLPLPSQTQGAEEAIAARQVVDGLALLQRYRAGRTASSWTSTTIPFGQSVPPSTVVLPPPNRADAHFAAIEDELRGLEATVDAVGDLTIAEAIHQLAQGNPERAGAALEAIALGEAPPPRELDVIDTPRSGIGTTHRVMVLFSGAPASTWGATTPRARAEPHLAAWAAALLGPEAPTAACQVTYVDLARDLPIADATGQAWQRTIALRELALGPLDIVYARSGEQGAAASELEQRVSWYALQPPPVGVRPAEVPASAGVRIALHPDGVALTFAEVLEVARTIRDLVTSSRAIAPADLALPDADVPASAEEDAPGPNEASTSPERTLRLTSRADVAAAELRRAHAALEGVLAAGSTLNVDDARRRLLDVAMFGVTGAVPLSPAGTGDEARAALHAQVLSVLKELRGRASRLDGLDAVAAALATAASRRDHDVARMQEVFGEEFRVLPRVTAPDIATLHAALAASTRLQDDRPLEAVTWLQRAARVRDAVARLDQAHMYAEALGGSALSLVVGQLPLVDNPRWAGLAPPPATPFPGGLSLVLQAPWPVDVRGHVSGLLIDEWVEVVPNATETTGVTFHFNRPNARAPQAILLAVPPDDASAWDLETLEATLLETLELAKLRTVDPASLGEIEQFLPAVYLPQPGEVDTITTDLARVVAGPGA